MMKNKKVYSLILVVFLIFSCGCDVRKKIDSLKEKGEAGILPLSEIAKTHESAFIRISAVYALGEISSIDVVDEVIAVYEGITPFLRENYESVIDDYLSRTGMYSVELENIEYAMREACMDVIFKKYVKRQGFYSKTNSARIRPTYRARNIEHKDKVVEFLYKIMISPSMPIDFDNGKGIRYRAAYLLNILDVRYVIPEMYELLLDAGDTTTKQELLDLIMHYGDIKYFPLDDDKKKHLISITEELKLLSKDKAA